MPDPGCQEPTSGFGMTLPSSGDHPAPDAATSSHTPPPCHGNHPEHPKHKQLIFSSLQGGFAQKGKGWGEDTSPARTGIWGGERPCPPTGVSAPCRPPPCCTGCPGQHFAPPTVVGPQHCPPPGFGVPHGAAGGTQIPDPLAPAWS